MESSLLWYDTYSKTLKPTYYRCIESRTIRYNQFTIACYVEDNKVSHVDEEVNTKVIETIAEKFGNLKVSRGKKDKFLVMDKEFLAECKLFLLMKYYIEESIDFVQRGVKHEGITNRKEGSAEHR